MNVLSCQLKDDIPTKLATSERLVHESQSSKTVDDDTKTGVTVLVMDDMQVKAHLIQNSVRIASWTLMRQEIFEITRTQQYTDSQPVSMQIGAHPKSKGKGKDSKDKGKSKDAKGRSKDKDAKNESSKKVKGDDQRSCYYCQKTGRVKSQCNTRLKDLADAEGKPVTANSHLNDTAAVVPSHCSLPDEHAMTCHMATPCVEKKTPCEYFNVETMMRPTGCSTAPTWTERVKLISAIPTCETFRRGTLVRAEASVQEDLIKPHRTTQRWQQCNS